MSVTISNCDEIARSPTNNSPSKMLYTFPKTSRFHSRKQILYQLSHLGATASMIYPQPSLTVGRPLLASDTNTTLPMSNYALK